MIKQLTRLATHLDAKGLTKEADILDRIIRKLAGPIKTELEKDEAYYQAEDKRLYDLLGEVQGLYVNCRKRERAKGAPEESIETTCSEHRSKFQSLITEREENNIAWKKYIEENPAPKLPESPPPVTPTPPTSQTETAE